jgi:glycosyltransferase involved in cell wall biosynthesis
MKIAFIGLRMFPADFEGVSGIETRGEEIINHFSNIKSNQIYVFVRSWVNKKKIQRNKNKNIQIIPIFTINNKYLDTPIYSFFSSLVVLFLPVDIIFYEGTGATLFSFIPKLFGKKIITTIHALEWKRKKWGFIGQFILKLAEKISILFSDKVIVVSGELKKYLLEKYKIMAFYIPYYLEFKKPVKPNIINKKYGLDKGNYLLFLGRLVPEKRVDWLIKAYLRLRPNIKLVLAGGVSHSDKYVRNLLKLAAKNKQIIFTGYVFGREKEELLSNCLLFILPSDLEGSSIALFEALSYKKRVFVGDLLESRKMINNNQYLFTKDNFDDFYINLKNLLNRNGLGEIELNRAYFISKNQFFKQYDSIISCH